MDIINGIYTSAKIFTVNTAEHTIDPYAIAQIQMLCDNECFEDSKIRIMPDVHPGTCSFRLFPPKQTASLKRWL